MDTVLEGEINLQNAAEAMVEMDNAPVGEYIMQQVNEDAIKPEDQEENVPVQTEAPKVVKNDAGDLAMLMEQVGGQDGEEVEVAEKKTAKEEAEQGGGDEEAKSEDMEEGDAPAEDEDDEEWQGSGESEEEAVKVVHSYTRKPRNVGISRQGRASKTSQAPTRASVVASDQLRASSKINQDYARRGKSGHNTRTHMQDVKEEDSYSSEEDKNNRGLFTCGACGKQYDSKKELYVHSLTHTVRQKFLCQICDKSFNNENMYKRHQAMHMKEERKKTVCQICNIVFNKRAELEQHHFEVHVGEKAFQCDSCGLEFSWRENYQKHMRIHRQRPYMCALCKQDFSDVKSLSVHIATHETDKGKDAQAVEDDIKPHTCDLCGLKFKFSFTLEAHMKNHVKDERATSVIELKQAAAPAPVPPPVEVSQTKSEVVDFDAKNFVCHICDSAFKWKFSLDAHLIIHEQGDKRKAKASRGRVRTRGGLTRAAMEENGNGDDSHDYVPSSGGRGRGRGPRTRGRGSRGRRGRPPIVVQPQVDADFPEPELFEDMPEPSRGPKRGRKSRMIIEAHASGMVQEELEGEIERGEERSEEEVVEEEVEPQPKRAKKEKRRSSKGDRRYPDESDEAVSPTSSPRTKGSPARKGIFDIMQNEITPEKESKRKSSPSKEKGAKKDEVRSEEKKSKRGRKPKKSEEYVEEEEEEGDNVSPKPLTIFTCDVCHKDFKAYDSLKVHKLCHKVEKHIAYGSSPMQSPERNEEESVGDQAAAGKEDSAWVRKAKAAKKARKAFCVKQGKFFLHAIEAMVKRRKAFKCDICKRRFKLYVELLTDQHRHRYVKAFKCPKKKCKARYPRKAALVIHAMRHGLELYMS